MHNILLFLLIATSVLSAKTVEPKVMRAQSNNNHPHNNHHNEDYDNSSHAHDREDDILSSSVEASSEITVMVTIEASSEATSETHQGNARLSYLDDNRVQITQNIAQGHGEYLSTLLQMMNLSTDDKSLEKIQKNFDNLVYLSHPDFLDKLEAII